MSYSGELKLAKSLAHKAGDIMRSHFRSITIGTTWKADNTELTVADTAINTMVIKEIAKTFANDGVLGEEESIHKERKRLWVCDPIDGTFPYSHAIPVSSFNLALVIDGEPVVSVLYDPFLDRLFHAVKGEGAFLNDERLNIKDVQKSRYGISVEAWGGSTSSLFDDFYVDLKIRKALKAKNYIQLYHCSVAYTAALVASGDLDGVVFAGTNPWDAAAACLIVKEAGGVFTSMFGKDQKYNSSTKGFIGGTPKQHAYLLERLRPIIETEKLR